MNTLKINKLHNSTVNERYVAHGAYFGLRDIVFVPKFSYFCFNNLIETYRN